jgi:hypothetical protein
MPDWNPAFKFNLLTGSPLAFQNTVNAFERWRQEQPLTPLTIVSGWHLVTAQMAEDFLRRNLKNRKVKLPVVRAYAVQLANGQWQKTGQPIIFTDDERLLDGQHRLWACYFTGKPFETYVVTGVPAKEQLFAYVDYCAPRTGGDSLDILGLNGLSKHLAAVVNDLAYRSDQNALSIGGRSSVGRLSPHEVAAYIQDTPELRDAAKYIEDNYKAAKNRLGATIASFVAWKISEHHGVDGIDDFFTAVTADDLNAGHPVRLLRVLLHPDPPSLNRTERNRLDARVRIAPLPMTKALAFTITAFNCMQRGELNLAELPVSLSGPFPTIEPPSPSVGETENEAAE